MSNLVRHPHHLVDESPWPIIGAFARLLRMTGIAIIFSNQNTTILFIGLMSLVITSVRWWGDVSNEGTFLGFHSGNVELGLRWGIILFISSEVLFFVSFFWAFFHARLNPREALGRDWPPLGVLPFNCFKVPLLNTLILLSSGISVTWAHHSLIENSHQNTTIGLKVTIILGIYFTGIQALEYKEATFRIADSAYGSTFFIATGFHGIHVIVGTLFLIATLIRHLVFSFSRGHHFGFEAASWYWHFVDVVWLFLYVIMYWWRAN